MLLPEKLVTVFVPNSQNLVGALDLVTRVTDHRLASVDFRPLAIFPLPSRIESAEKELRVEWRERYQRGFEKKFCQVYALEQCTLTDYFDEVLLPYHPYYSYGEKLAVMETRPDSTVLSLGSAYQRFFRRLIESDFAWDVPGQEEGVATATPAVPAEPFRKKYDVFHDYDDADAFAVARLAGRLERYQVKQFFAAQDVLPGEEREAAVADAMRSSANIAIYVGVGGVSPERQRALLTQYEVMSKDSERRMIPVLLPGAGPDRVPDFLRAVNAVEFGGVTEDEASFLRLLSGIVGRSVEDITRHAPEPGVARTGQGAPLLHTDPHFSVVSRALMQGRVVPFIGSGINTSDRGLLGWRPGEASAPPSGGELAAHLASTVGYSEAGGGDDALARVAQLIALTGGAGALYDTLRGLLDVNFVPTSTHRFLAALPALIRESGAPPAYQLIVTTNYDDALERAFREAEEPFDLVSYVMEGEQRGKFMHRRADGEDIIIDKPNEYRGLSLDRRTVILKMHGAIDWGRLEQDAAGRGFVITEDDHIDYLLQAESAKLPVRLAARLQKSHVLFLGYNLREWSLRAVVQRIWRRPTLAYKSWAVQWNPDLLETRHWLSRDIEMLNIRLEEYTSSLREHLKAAPPTT
jgi:hypothetical protein